MKSVQKFKNYSAIWPFNHRWWSFNHSSFDVEILMIDDEENLCTIALSIEPGIVWFIRMIFSSSLAVCFGID